MEVASWLSLRIVKPPHVERGLPLGTYSASDSATTFSKAVRALRAAMPRVPLRSLASLSSTKSFFWSLS